MIALPGSFSAYAGRSAAWSAFVDAVPRTLADLSEEWRLRVDGAPTHGFCAVVVPMLDADGRETVLKVGFLDDDTQHEHLALQHWHGDGAVRLLRADPRRGALLLERLEVTDLSEAWDIAACEAIGELYGVLHRPAPPQLRRLSVLAARTAQGLRELPRDAPLPRRLVEQAATLARDLAADESTDGRLIHTDLHYANVLHRDGVPVAIDPKPLSGDPPYEVAPLLWNRWSELDGDVRGGVRRRFHATIDAAGLDEDRARDWVVVRMVQNALWHLQERADGVRRLESSEDWLTQCITVAKAVQD